MLIKFSIENWMSFRNPVTFSMIATREQQHSERVPKIEKYDTSILPIAALYGGNASGKTNFFKALSFAKRLIVQGTQPDSLIPVEPFLLDSKGVNAPSHFVFEILVNDEIYEYSFSVTSRAVLEEKLVLIRSTSERVLYSRHDGKYHFDNVLEKKMKLQEKKGFLKFASQGTRDNQLFLTNLIFQKVDLFLPVFNWFKETLVLVAPDSRFEPFEHFLDESNPLYLVMGELLPQLDTGIAHLGGDTIPYKNIPIGEDLKTRFQEELKEGMTLRVRTEPNKDAFAVTRKDGDLIAKKMVTFHPKEDGTEIKFEINQESDGSKRIIDLLPAFLELFSQITKRVYIIDEIDRCLHTSLTRELLNFYLNSCSEKTRSQLLLTTHDVLLMDQKLFRRDEIWVTERDASGSSSLFAFSDYKDVRKDKDIRKSYLQGRLGGIPRILLGSGAMRQSLVNDRGENGRCP